VCLKLISVTHADFGLSLGIGAAAVVGLGSYVIPTYVTCLFKECCEDSRWFLRNVTGLRDSFTTRLHGQHLVSKGVFDSLRSHLSKSPANPPKHPLVLSFHGWTGCGKNHVSKLIAEHLYKEGLKSNYVMQFVSTLHFTGCLIESCPSEAKLAEYREWIQKQIKQRVSKCPHSLFIFDEMDKMPLGLIDTISAFLDHRDSVDGVDYRFAIFIFLSNAGGNAIAKKTFEFYKGGKAREDLTMRDLEGAIGVSVFNSKEGGLKRSSIVDHNLVDHFIPFLPLERSHVKACIADYLVNKRIAFGKRETDEDGKVIILPFKKKEQMFIEKVLDELDFDTFSLYSLSGCKRISAKVESLLPDVEEDLVDGPWRL